MKIYENPEIKNNSVIYYSVSEEKYSVSEAKPDTQNITEYSVYQNIQNNSVQLQKKAQCNKPKVGKAKKQKDEKSHVESF